MTRRVDAWNRSTIGHGVRLICAAASNQAEVIVRHETYCAMIRGSARSCARTIQARRPCCGFPPAGALLPRPRRGPNRSATRPPVAGDLLTAL